MLLLLLVMLLMIMLRCRSFAADAVRFCGKFGRGGRERAEEKFGWPAIAQETKGALYERRGDKAWKG